MKYIRVNWSYRNPETPTILYSELDDERREVRKVEIFGDERLGYAGPGIECDGTMLGLVPVPDLDEIAKDPQFEPIEISREEFESIWSKRTT